MTYQPTGIFKVSEAPAALAAGLQAIDGGQKVIDFSGVTAIDSSAVAVLIAWQRAAQNKSTVLSFINFPQSLQGLSSLYDVDVLLPGETDLSRFVSPTA